MIQQSQLWFNVTEDVKKTKFVFEMMIESWKSHIGHIEYQNWTLNEIKSEKMENVNSETNHKSATNYCIQWSEYQYFNCAKSKWGTFLSFAVTIVTIINIVNVESSFHHHHHRNHVRKRKKFMKFFVSYRTKWL